MKKLLTFCILTVSFAALAKSESALDDIRHYYDDIHSSVDLLDFNYYISFSVLQNNTDDYYSYKSSIERCKEYDLIKPSTIQSVTKEIMENLKEATDIIDSEGIDFSTNINIEQVLSKLEKQYSNNSVGVCADTSSGSFSDGNKTSIVFIEGQAKFAFQTGYPD
jgi:hypothetical protein